MTSSAPSMNGLAQIKLKSYWFSLIFFTICAMPDSRKDSFSHLSLLSPDFKVICFLFVLIDLISVIQAYRGKSPLTKPMHHWIRFKQDEHKPWTLLSKIVLWVLPLSMAIYFAQRQGIGSETFTVFVINLVLTRAIITLVSFGNSSVRNSSIGGYVFSFLTLSAISASLVRGSIANEMAIATLPVVFVVSLYGALMDVQSLVEIIRGREPQSDPTIFRITLGTIRTFRAFTHRLAV